MGEIASSVLLDPSSFSYVVGIDIGSETCCFTVLTPQKHVVIKPTELANAAPGFAMLQERITRLGRAPAQIVVGLEATSRDAGESLSLSPATGVSPVEVRILDKPMSRPAQRGLRAKTDRLDASTIARVLRSRRSTGGLCAR